MKILNNKPRIQFYGSRKISPGKKPLDPKPNFTPNEWFFTGSFFPDANILLVLIKKETM